MIVCHCNQISAERIYDTTRCLMNKEACPDLCPAKVYKELGCCAKCCNCFPLAQKIIQDAAHKHVHEAPITVHRQR